MDFDQICQKISSNVFKIGRNVASMQKLVSQLGTSAEIPNTKPQLASKRSEVQASIETTNTMLRQAADLCKGVVPQEEKSRKIQVERLKHQFSDALMKFKKYQALETEKERAAVNRMRSRTESLRSEMRSGPADHQYDADSNSLMDDDTRQQNLSQLQEFTDDLETTTALINEREEAIKRLESDMVTVNDIFREIGAMVHEQGDMIDNIEHNVVVAHDRVEEGNTALSKASQYQNKYRKKIVILLGILVGFGLILGLIIYFSLRKKK